MKIINGLLISIFIISTLSFAQNIIKISSEDSSSGFLQQDPRLYFAPDNNIIVAWEDHRYGQPTYFAQKIDNTFNPVGENFGLASNLNVVQNDAGVLLCARDIDYPNDFEGGGCFVTYGFLYNNQEPIKTNFPFFGACYGWCGTGFTGEDRVTLPLADGFLFMGRYDLNIEFIRISNSGDTTNTKHGPYNTNYDQYIVAIDMAKYNDSLNVIAWFELVDYDTLSGPFYGFLDNKDSLIAKYNLRSSLDKAISFYSIIDRRMFKLKVLPDQRIALYFCNYESKKLYSFNIPSPGQTAIVDSFSINPAIEYPNYYGLNITNTVDNHYYVIVKEREHPSYIYYGYKFNDSGLSSGMPFEEVSYKDLILEEAKYAGDDNLIVSAKADNDIYLYNTNLLQKTDSIKLNNELPNSNERNSQIINYDDESFFITWNSGNNFFGRKVTNIGTIDDNAYQLYGSACRFSENIAINYWSYGINFLDKEFNVINSDTLGTPDYWYNVAADIYNDSLVIAVHADKEKINLSKYDALGNLLQHKLFTMESNQYYNLQLFFNEDGTFWLNSGNKYIQKYDLNLEPLSDFTHFNFVPQLKLKDDQFFGYLTYYSEFYQFKKGYLLSSQKDTIQAYDEMPPYNVEFKAHKINDKSFILTWIKERKVIGKVYHTDGSTEPEFTIHQTSESVSIVDAAFGRNGDKSLFTWSDNLIKDEGYSVRGQIRDINTITSIKVENPNHPKGYQLSNAYPNPFNPSTNFDVFLPQNGLLEAAIYNIRGQLVKTIINQKMASGKYQFKWDGRSSFNIPVSSGIYFLKTRFRNHSLVKKLVLLK